MMWEVNNPEPANEFAFSTEPELLDVEFELDDDSLW